MSPNGNSVTQLTPANQPVFKKNSINGQPSVWFNGTTSTLEGPNVFPTNSDYSILAVVRYTSEKDNTIIGSSSGMNHGLLISDTDRLSVFHAANPSGYSTGSLSINVPTLIESISTNSSNTIQYYVNGISSGSATAANINSDSSLAIGQLQSLGDYFSGDIAEIFLFSSVLQANDRALIEQYLNAKYHLY